MNEFGIIEGCDKKGIFECWDRQKKAIAVLGDGD